MKCSPFSSKNKGSEGSYLKNVILVFLLIAPIAFGLPTLEGTRGTNFVSSACCEDMGQLWLYAASGYPMQSVENTFTLLPVASLSFTPWHYLEFSAYGRGMFWHQDAANNFVFPSIGGHVKGSIPFTQRNAPVKLAAGIDGFAKMFLKSSLDVLGMQISLGSNTPIFGGKLLFSIESQHLSGHLNAVYTYVSGFESSNPLLGTTVSNPNTQSITGGVGLETSPISWLNAFVDFNYPYQLQFSQSNQGDNSNGATGSIPGLSDISLVGGSFGVRVPLKLGPMWMLQLSAFATNIFDSENMSITPYAGIAIGGDLIKEKELFLKGKVADAKTGNPVPGAEITIEGPYRDSIIQLTTDEAGRFNIPDRQLLETDSMYVTTEGFHPERVTAQELGAYKAALAKKEKRELRVTLSPMEKEVFLAGVVLDAQTSEPLKAVINLHNMETGDIIEPAASDPVSGFYRIVLKPGLYRMKTSAQDYKDNLRTVAVEESETHTVDVFLLPKEKEEKPEPKPLEPVAISGFGRGRVEPGFESMAEMEKVVKLLEENPDATVVITGHTDSVGPKQMNYQLGMERARTVAEFFVMQGIKSSRIEVKSGGELYPVADNRYRSGRAANRRVELNFSRNPEKLSSNGVTVQESNL